MERLLVCKLTAAGCVAEVALNGVPVARVGAVGDPGAGAGADARSASVLVPVHEYASGGTNTLALVVHGGEPATAPSRPPAPARAAATLLLPRTGHAVDETRVRTLAGVEWQQEGGTPPAWPQSRSVEVELPIAFPRWRWMDAPVHAVTPALRLQLLGWVQGLARALAEGDPAPFLAATRLRTEELALAYQREAGAETERLRGHLQALQAAGRLTWTALDATNFALRPVAGGRLLECLGAEGAPALSTVPSEAAPGEGSLAFPLRLAVVEGRPYALR